ncbi:hypothetical protein G8A07_04175 [Roseateles sp. DAIF2]|uniref:hypothetical protein n=1 Tax=Roseateles sp. DAIF2 TaxID=2714952 RepID=UPI0018A31589|nr:hypothetical protein [Roseateles sp. DAIF2]QPF72204.1 hypothetical protein G8A07_04175 [Roseateles sp. DAIF2]
MRLEPYVRVDGRYAFSLTVEELLRLRGEPWRRQRNTVELDAYDYGDMVFRFQDGGRLEEITLQAPVLEPGPVLAVPFASLADFVEAQDPQHFRRAGFLVSPALGIAFDPGEPCWLTVLARFCLPQWEALGG